VRLTAASGLWSRLPGVLCLFGIGRVGVTLLAQNREVVYRSSVFSGFFERQENISPVSLEKAVRGVYDVLQTCG